MKPRPCKLFGTLAVTLWWPFMLWNKKNLWGGGENKTPRKPNRNKTPSTVLKKTKTKQTSPPKTVFERVGVFYLLIPYFFLLIQDAQKVDSENQTLLMTDVINRTDTIITQASIVGFQLLDKPLQRYDPFSQERLFSTTNLFSFTGNKNDGKLYRSLTNARQHMGNCLTCLHS